MNYKKKYMEALERMKSWARGEHPECFTEAQKAAEFIFPELKESDDEKIRNGLIGYFRAGRCENISSYHGISTNDILVWLEKAMFDAGYVFDFKKKELKKIIDESKLKIIFKITVFVECLSRKLLSGVKRIKNV